MSRNTKSTKPTAAKTARKPRVKKDLTTLQMLNKTLKQIARIDSGDASSRGTVSIDKKLAKAVAAKEKAEARIVALEAMKASGGSASSRDELVEQARELAKKLGI